MVFIRKKSYKSILFAKTKLAFVPAGKSVSSSLVDLSGRPDNTSPTSRPDYTFPGNFEFVRLGGTGRVEPKLGSKGLPKTKQTRSSSSGGKAVKLMAGLVLTLGIAWSAIWFGPGIFFRVFPPDSIIVKPQEEGTPLGGDYVDGTDRTTKEVVLPPQNPNLPDGKWLIIPKIGVRSQIEEGQDYWSAMERGVWLVPEFGQPGDISKPMILTSHRYGFKWWWEGDYWKYHSFYNLTLVEPGDMVEVIADKRKYTYEVYQAEEGKQISDYQADAILYTCKYLNSDVRYFRYLRLINTAKDSQASL